MTFTLAAIQEILGLLPILGSGSAGVVKAWTDFKAALQADGVEADTATLDFVIADAARRKAHEDEILNGGGGQ